MSNIFNNFKLWLQNNNEYNDEFLSLSIPYLISLFIKSKNLYLINNLINNFYLSKIDKKELLFSIKDLLRLSGTNKTVFFNIKKENNNKKIFSKMSKNFPYYKSEELEIILNSMNNEDKEIIEDIFNSQNKKIKKNKSDILKNNNKKIKKRIKTFKEWVKCFGK